MAMPIHKKRKELQVTSKHRHEDYCQRVHPKGLPAQQPDQRKYRVFLNVNWRATKIAALPCSWLK